jgi:hypothetical protein
MRSLFHRDGDAPRLPLAGRLVGLAVGVTLLSLSVLFALHVVALLIPVVVPLFALVSIYAVMFGRRHHK